MSTDSASALSTSDTLRGREREIVIKTEIIETTSLGDRSYLAHDGTVALAVDPQRDIDRVLDAGRRRGVRSPMCWKPTSTTTTSAAASSSPARVGAPLPARRRRPGALSTAPRGRRRRLRRSAGSGWGRVHTPGHTHHHLELRAGRRRRRVRRCSPAAHCCTAPTGRPTCSAPRHRRPHPGPVRLGAPAGRRTARRRPGLPTHGFGSFCAATQTRATRPPSGEQAR